MRLSSPTRVSAVWIALILATLFSWGSAHSLGPDRLLTPIVLVVAFIKARLIGLEFMELRAAPRALRAIFEAWVLGACASLLALYLLSPTL